MLFTADFHIHSKFSIAASRDMDLENISRWAVYKGLDLVSTGDITQPLWLLELRRKLRPLGNGLFKFRETHFILTGEVTCVFHAGQAVKKAQFLIFVPGFEHIEKINRTLAKYGDLTTAGRPVLNMDGETLVKAVLDVSTDCMVVPSHAWTPEYSVFGAKTGFDSLEECFGNYARYVYSVETGLSTDPAMNARVSALDKLSLISNSNAYSPEMIGREANVFNGALHYHEIKQILQFRHRDKFLYTLESYPESGKYYYNGHKACGFYASPKEAKSINNTCHICKKPLTKGVLQRIEELADRDEKEARAKTAPFKSYLPLDEVLAEVFEVETKSQKVYDEYVKLVEAGGNEYNILFNLPEEQVKKLAPFRIAEAIMKTRRGEVQTFPGYDGEYGRIRIFREGESRKETQMDLF
jgi:uncharacterized protein (TIGR00375 family)